MPGECQVNVKSQSELDIGGREACFKQNLFPLLSRHGLGLLNRFHLHFITVLVSLSCE